MMMMIDGIFTADDDGDIDSFHIFGYQININKEDLRLLTTTRLQITFFLVQRNEEYQIRLWTPKLASLSCNSDLKCVHT